ncbi:hypothetical protein P4O66_001250 [Electrophorus voltai]|uniref:Uncharacterized protein n=1 Tax=Electrophorus voltai TaxID=2609070 RepID=A0AAD8ZAT7_9TELE|nr:hypothetical protein P4O66_001250 [Electrophorus voltai]
MVTKGDHSLDCLTLPTVNLCSTSVESPAENHTFTVPQVYQDLAMVFSKQRATLLSPHRTYDFSIDLLEGAVLPKAHIYPLSQEEEKAMETYISEALSQDFIQPSTFPRHLASSFGSFEPQRTCWAGEFQGPGQILDDT